MSGPDVTGRCPPLDPRLGARAFAVALIHAVGSRGHASCAIERIGLALVTENVRIRGELVAAAAVASEAASAIASLTPRPDMKAKWLH